VVEVAGRTIGLLADDAREFIPIPDASIHPPSDSIGGLSGNYLEGVATIGDRIVLILNLDHVIDVMPNVAA
jgi:purine-binding chemotaxis protein CheW